MVAPGLDVVSTAIRATVDALTTNIVAAIPLLISGLLFFTLASVGIRLVSRILRAALHRIYGPKQELVADLIVTIVSLFLWFGAALTLLKIVGMGDIAASLGTAAGFIALGVSYALSDMIADTVAGVYLLRDPDFNVGDRVTTGSTTGTVIAIELRKSRFRLADGDVVVLANRDVEKQWTKENELPVSDADATTDDGSTS